MNKNSLLFASLLLLGACGSHSSFAPLSLCGTFEGMLPAASGPGIKTTIVLNKDNTYTEKDVYVGEANGTFIEQGSYNINDGIIKLMPADDEISFYQIENGQIRRLDSKRQPISGSLSEFYILKQTASCN